MKRLICLVTLLLGCFAADVKIRKVIPVIEEFNIYRLEGGYYVETMNLLYGTDKVNQIVTLGPWPPKDVIVHFIDKNPILIPFRYIGKRYDLPFTKKDKFIQEHSSEYNVTEYALVKYSFRSHDKKEFDYRKASKDKQMTLSVILDEIQGFDDTFFGQYIADPNDKNKYIAVICIGFDKGTTKKLIAWLK